MAGEYPELEKLIGVKTVAEDWITPSQIQRLNVTLNRPDPLPKEGDPVPWGWHSLFFPRLIPTDRLSPDGMAPDFVGAPDSPLPRRMYAGNDLRFSEPLRVGDRATKEMFVKSVTPKEGRSGRLVFVTYGVRILGPCGLVLEDDQKLVFRDEEPPGAKPSTPPSEPAQLDAPWKRKMTVDPVMLFRFSACTFNPHRIHYDYPYVTQVERYPGLIVHGPLAAVLLLELMREHWKDKAMKMSGFAMRATAPLFASRPITLLGEPAPDGASCRLWTVDDVRRQAMEISATFRPD
jgi:3-methylfumaryl-CoA hydratase